ncbi:tRNA 2-selenouridine(34) synthase MnmH [Roseinatronobacter monicus]|uniref:tRNA 2-selenouridine(34) synthase MnmH n=1 Tax=Roseinatronobacter monicus TaxID=393481 RepID=UPI003F3D799A
MNFVLNTLQHLQTARFDTVIDARAPAEYAEDHLPGAINLPVLDDDERARVGTIYKQDSPFTARKLGAALVAQNAARHLLGALADKPGDWQPLLYCWRGGQRSGSFATILRQIGWRAEVLEGGYKSYRKLVQTLLYDGTFPAPILLIDGGTGSAKTEILARVAARGGQVIDLEGLAVHRGSLFGGLTPQPSQKMFETHLAQAICALDRTRPVLIEAESNRIGDIRLPPALWRAMQAAPRVQIDAPVAARAAYSLRAYSEFAEQPDKLSTVIEGLRPYQPAAQIEAWHALATTGDFATLAESLIAAHYDPSYQRMRKGQQAVLRIALDDLSEKSQEIAADRIFQQMIYRESESAIFSDTLTPR